jgi:hypothetical protein
MLTVTEIKLHVYKRFQSALNKILAISRVER